MCAGCFAIAGRSHGPAINIAFFYGHCIEGFSQHGGLYPCQRALALHLHANTFFLEMQTRMHRICSDLKPTGSRSRSSVCKPVFLGYLPGRIVASGLFLTTVDFPCSGKESYKLCIHLQSRQRTWLLQ